MTVVSVTTVPTKTILADYSFARPDPAWLKQLGIKGVIRYLSYSTHNKNLTVAERDLLHAAGLPILLLWENAGGDPKLGRWHGRDHGAEAVRQAQALGYPKGLALYVACDFDTLDTVEQFRVSEYLAAFSLAVRTAGYLCGLYGGSRIWWQNRGVIDTVIRAAASSWSPPSIVWGPQIRQGVQHSSHTFDYNFTTTTIPMWFPHTVTPPFVPAFGLFGTWPYHPKPVLRIGAHGDPVMYLQGVLRKDGDKLLAVDGQYGPRTFASAKLFQKRHHLTVDGIVGPQTWAAVDKVAVA